MRETPYTSARFAIRYSDTLSTIILMTANLRDAIFITATQLMTVVLISLFGIWQYAHLNPRNTVLYSPAKMVEVEYTILGTVAIFRYLPRLVTFVGTLKQFASFVGMWKHSHSYGGRMLVYAIVSILLKQFILPTMTLVLSAYVAFFETKPAQGTTSNKSLFSVLFRLLVFDFINNIESGITNAYIDYFHAADHLRMDIKDIVFENGSKKFWDQSLVGESCVVKAFEATDGSTQATQVILTMMSPEKGLGISPHGGTHCSLVLSVERDEGMATNAFGIPGLLYGNIKGC